MKLRNERGEFLPIYIGKLALMITYKKLNEEVIKMRSFVQVEYDENRKKWFVYVDEYTADYQGIPYWAGHVAGSFDTEEEAKECAKEEKKKLVF